MEWEISTVVNRVINIPIILYGTKIMDLDHRVSWNFWLLSENKISLLVLLKTGIHTHNGREEECGIRYTQFVNKNERKNTDKHVLRDVPCSIIRYTV